MRVIAGEAKGRALVAPPGEGTRPTSDKLRGALFNILYGRVAGSRVLDLFGGTGALALEAISRGADSAVIVDSDRAAIAAIHRNAQAVAGADYETPGVPGSALPDAGRLRRRDIAAEGGGSPRGRRAADPGAREGRDDRPAGGL